MTRRTNSRTPKQRFRTADTAKKSKKVENIKNCDYKKLSATAVTLRYRAHSLSLSQCNEEVALSWEKLFVIFCESIIDLLSAPKTRSKLSFQANISSKKRDHHCSPALSPALDNSLHDFKEFRFVFWCNFFSQYRSTGTDSDNKNGRYIDVIEREERGIERKFTLV